ncbi:Protein kinase alk2 [Leucoagaricus gongylophorus]
MLYRNTNKSVIVAPSSGSVPLYIPANTTVLYSVFLMHRRTDLWGPDGKVFRLHTYRKNWTDCYSSA